MTGKKPIQFQLNDLADEYQRSVVHEVALFGHHLKTVARTIEAYENRDGSFNDLVASLTDDEKIPAQTVRFSEGVDSYITGKPIQKDSVLAHQSHPTHPVAAFQLALANYETALKALYNYQLGDQQ